jgi:dTDP-glucose 4,6-dehydratase
VSRVVVTGAAGFLGSFLTETLLESGHEVVGMDNFFRGKRENLPAHNNFTFYEIDLVEQPQLIRDIFAKEQPEIVYHYAAINGTKYFYDIPFQVLDDNTRMTQNVLASLAGTKVQKVVYASSSEVYGHNPPIPTPEEEFIILNAQADRDSYASSKAIGEFYVMTYCKENDIDFLIIRPFNTYGPRMDNTEYGQVVPEFIRKVKHDQQFSIIGSGLQTRSFCYVEDHARLVSNMCDKVKIKLLT